MRGEREEQWGEREMVEGRARKTGVNEKEGEKEAGGRERRHARERGKRERKG